MSASTAESLNGHRDRLFMVKDRPPIDRTRAEHAVSELFEALGVDLTAPDLHDTPRRVAEMYEELLTPMPFNPTTFPNEDGYDELVLSKNIPFTSLCAHHALPFSGVAHVGYLPGERILGLSKLPRTVHYFSHSLQVQERLTKQIADWLENELEPRRGRCGPRGRASVHDHPRRSGRREQDRHLDDVRLTPRAVRNETGVPLTDRFQRLGKEICMCSNCGCRIPENKHDDERNINWSEIVASAEANDISPGEAVKNIVEMAKAQGEEV